MRELRNAVERAVILWPSDVIEPAAFPERIGSGPPSGPTVGGDYTLEDLERAHVLGVLARASTMEAAAHTLGIDDSTLWRKRKKYESG